MKPSWTLAGLCLLFLIAFFAQRSRSAVLQIEGDRALAERIARQTDLTLAESMALRELLGADRPELQLLQDARRLSLLRRDLPEDLAVLAAAGKEELARALWVEAGENPDRLASVLGARPEHIVPVRFAKMTSSFARRLPPRR